MSKETFKIFAKDHPELAKAVLNNNASWQKFYEIFEIYGENSNVWDSYIKKNIKETTTSFKDLFNTMRNIDLDSVQKGVDNLQKTIGLLQDIGIGNTQTKLPNYESRPMYKYFED